MKRTLLRCESRQGFLVYGHISILLLIMAGLRLTKLSPASSADGFIVEWGLMSKRLR